MATQTTHLGLTNQAGTDKNHRPVINGNNDIVDNWATGVDTHLANIDANMAFVAVQSGNNWQLPSGKSAASGEYIVVDGILGHATAAITGGSTNIVSGTNWTPETKGGLNALNDNIGNLRDKTVTPQTLVSVDLDDIVTTGVYLLGGSITHSPYGNYGYLVVIAQGTDLVQYYTNSNSAGTYIRRKYGGSWNDWEQLATIKSYSLTAGTGVSNLTYYVRKIGDIYIVSIVACNADVTADSWTTIASPTGFSPTTGNGIAVISDANGNPKGFARFVVDGATHEFRVKPNVTQQTAFITGATMICV